METAYLRLRNGGVTHIMNKQEKIFQWPQFSLCGRGQATLFTGILEIFSHLVISS